MPILLRHSAHKRSSAAPNRTDVDVVIVHGKEVTAVRLELRFVLSATRREMGWVKFGAVFKIRTPAGVFSQRPSPVLNLAVNPLMPQGRFDAHFERKSFEIRLDDRTLTPLI
jgi:hypothetical protein